MIKSNAGQSMLPIWRKLISAFAPSLIDPCTPDAAESPSATKPAPAIDLAQMEREIAREITSMPGVSPGIRREQDANRQVASMRKKEGLSADEPRPVDRLIDAERQAGLTSRVGRAMKKAGIESKEKLHALIGMEGHLITRPGLKRLLRGMVSPLAENGDFSLDAIAVATVLDTSPEILFATDPRRQDPAGKATLPIPGIDAVTPEREAMDRQAVQALIHAISAIKPKERDVILRRLKGDTYDNIARDYGYAKGSGKQSMQQHESRAIRRLGLELGVQRDHSAPLQL